MLFLLLEFGLPKDKLRITVIATGFEAVRPTRRELLERQYGSERSSAEAASSPAGRQAQSDEDDINRSRYQPNSLEIPAFLRRK